MQQEFCDEVQRLVDEKGEEYAREYFKTYCEVLLDDPLVPHETKTKILGVLTFLYQPTKGGSHE